MSRSIRDERGELGFIALVTVAVGLAGIAFLGALASGDIGAENKGDRGPRVNPNIAGALPCDQVADYAKERHKLYYTGSGFRSLDPELAEPTRASFPNDKAFIDAYAKWRGAMAATVSGAMSDLQAECELRKKRSDLPAPKPEPSAAPEGPAIDGTYAVQVTGSSGNECLSPPVSLNVAHSGNTITLANTRQKPTGGNTSDVFMGFLNTDFSFDARFSEEGTPSSTMSGRFETVSDGVLLRGGILRTTGCDYDFTAKRPT